MPGILKYVIIHHLSLNSRLGGVFDHANGKTPPGDWHPVQHIP